MDMKRIGASITAFRKANGYTQELLADKLRLSPQAVNKWETGAGLPEASVLIELVEIALSSLTINRSCYVQGLTFIKIQRILRLK